MRSPKKTSPKATVPGSDRQPLGNRVGDQSADEMIEVSVILKPKTRAAVPQSAAWPFRAKSSQPNMAPTARVIEKVKQFAKENDLTVSEVSPERRTVKLKGTAANMMRAFEVKLDRYEHEGHQYRARTGSIKLPAGLAPSVEAVLGLDNRPQAKTHFRVRGERASQSGRPRRFLYSASGRGALSVSARAWTAPGQTVGILELGGGYDPADLKNYFASLGIAEPTVISVSVDKGKNKPTNPNSADGEVLLDIEVVGAVAPGAKIVVYFAPNTSQGFQDALTTAIHDATNKPSVISISWGGAESTWTAQSMTAFDSAAQDAAALGVTICAASGDNGSERRSERRRQSRGFSGLQPARSGLRRHQPAERQWSHHQRNGVERRRPGRRRRRRVQRSVSVARMAGEREYQASVRRRARRAGRGRRCGPRDRLQRAGGRRIVGDRRDQRGGAAVERPDCAAEPKAGKTAGLSAAGAVWTAGEIAELFTTLRPDRTERFRRVPDGMRPQVWGLPMERICCRRYPPAHRPFRKPEAKPRRVADGNSRLIAAPYCSQPPPSEL